ncbi:TPA: hypothetical protein ACKP4S_000363 [Stenotrophomonas maltophilia]|jgi:hypothetical protein|uniref:hypothetical protein n=1 Tax=Stenotrophomonas sp. SMYL86 TaxID=3076044 RepID=UPI001312AF3F|nr:hypothetical protein [Stenotrophomonas sp. SMYL86]
MVIQSADQTIALSQFSQVEVTAWLQVGAAIAALFCAFYVPIRMRRIDELERLRSVIDCVNQVNTICQYFKDAVADLENAVGTVPVEFIAAHNACESHKINPGTPANLLPALSQIVRASNSIQGNWITASSHPDQRSNEKFISKIGSTADGLSHHHEALKRILKHWRRKHWFVLLFV